MNFADLAAWLELSGRRWITVNRQLIRATDIRDFSAKLQSTVGYTEFCIKPILDQIFEGIGFGGFGFDVGVVWKA